MDISSRADLLRSGLTDHQLESARLKGRGLQRVHRGWYAPAGELTACDAASAATAAAGTRAVASHCTAARLHELAGSSGLPGFWTPPVETEISLPRSWEVSQRAGVVIHRCTIDPRDVVSLHGVRTTGVIRTLADVALTQSPFAAIAMLDDALHRGLITPGELQNVRRILRCRTGAAKARWVIDHADGRSESALESVSRLRFIQLGLMPTELQHKVVTSRGVVLARGDFLFVGPNRPVIGEADSRKFHEGDMRVHDAEREEALRHLGYEVVRWTWAQVAQDAESVVKRIRAFM